MTGLVFKRAARRMIVTAGAVFAMLAPAAASAAVTDCPRGVKPALASSLPTGRPAARLAMARTKPRLKPAAPRKARPAVVQPAKAAKPDVVKSTAAKPKPRRPQIAKVRRPHRTAAGQPTSPWVAAANLAQPSAASLLEPTACASPNAAPDVVAPTLRLSMARSAAPAEVELTPMPSDFGAVDASSGGTGTPGVPSFPTTTPATGGPTVILPPAVTNPTTEQPTDTPFTPPTGLPGTDPSAPPVVPGVGKPGDNPLTPGTQITSPQSRPLVDGGTGFPLTPPTGPGIGGPGVGGPGTGNPGTGNPGAVPEPGAWALLIVGFGFVGAAARARRRRLHVD